MDSPILMIVDDEPGVRESVRYVFQQTFRVEEVSSGQEAIEKVKEYGPEVVLLDILMPGKDGVEVLKEIKAVRPESEVIMLTAVNNAGTAFVSKEYGAFDYVTKPFDVGEMRLKVERALEKVKLSRERK